MMFYKKAFIYFAVASLGLSGIAVQAMNLLNSPQKALKNMKEKDYFATAIQQQFAEAIRTGRIDHLGDLLEAGADPNKEEKNGVTPLIWSMIKQNIISYEWLILHGADPNYIAKNTDKNVLSVMQAAAIAEDSNYLQIALKYGGNPNQRLPISDGTILISAVENNRINNIKLLINAGANINHQDKNGYTPIMMAVLANRYQICCVLMELGADIKLKTNNGNNVCDLLDKYGGKGLRADNSENKWLKLFRKMIKEGGECNGGSGGSGSDLK